jgi:hypothetical protein
MCPAFLDVRRFKSLRTRSGSATSDYRAVPIPMTSIGTSTYRYKPLRRKRKSVAIEGPAIVTPADPKRCAALLRAGRRHRSRPTTTARAGQQSSPRRVQQPARHHGGGAQPPMRHGRRAVPGDEAPDRRGPRHVIKPGRPSRGQHWEASQLALGSRASRCVGVPWAVVRSRRRATEAHGEGVTRAGVEGVAFWLRCTSIIASV